MQLRQTKKVFTCFCVHDGHQLNKFFSNCQCIINTTDKYRQLSHILDVSALGNCNRKCNKTTNSLLQLTGQIFR
uniref:Uncharacterized protein n=1 Tax=Lepeophtheirus salmonis TaxID=72036 RepID=A0A0K2UKI9_LEPSM